MPRLGAEGGDEITGLGHHRIAGNSRAIDGRLFL